MAARYQGLIARLLVMSDRCQPTCLADAPKALEMSVRQTYLSDASRKRQELPKLVYPS